MKKRTSRVSRRIVSLLMSMVLTLTLVTPAAFATEVVGGSGTTIVEGDTNPADPAPGEDSENNEDKNTEDGKDEQPTEPGDEDKNPDEDNGDDASKPDGDSKDKENPDGDKKDEENKDEQPTEEPTDEIDTQEGEGTDPVAVEPNIEWYTKDKDVKKFTISSAADLLGLAQLVNGEAKETAEDGTTKNIGAINFSDCEIVLANDIDLSTVCHPADESGAAEVNWTPIGNDASHAFAGTFDGDGHTISNLYISLEQEWEKAAKLYQGLLGNVSKDGIVQNLIVTGSVAVTNSVNKNVTYVGGIVGGNSGTVQNCGFYGTVQVKKNLSTNVTVGNGGVVGSGNALNCWYYRTNDAASKLGVCGGTATNCYQNAYNNANAKGTYKISDSFKGIEVVMLLNDKRGDGKAWKPGAIHPEFLGADEKLVVLEKYDEACTANVEIRGTADMYTVISDADVITVTLARTDNGVDKIVCQMKDGTVKTEVTKEGTAVPISAGINLIYYGTEKNFNKIKPDTTWYSANKNATITTKEQLAGLAKLVNDGTFKAKTVALGADIDLSGYVWSPIGTGESPFKGTFKGGQTDKTGKFTSYAISGLNGDLFGVVESGNNKLAAQYVTIDGGTGRLVNELKSGKVENCMSTAKVDSSDENAAVGGLVGMAETNATVSSSYYYNADSINVPAVGGSGTVTNCFYLAETSTFGSTADENGENGDTGARTAEEFASGQVACELTANGTTSYWGQTASEQRPKLSTTDTVYKVVLKMSYASDELKDVTVKAMCGDKSGSVLYVNSGAKIAFEVNKNGIDSNIHVAFNKTLVDDTYTIAGWDNPEIITCTVSKDTADYSWYYDKDEQEYKSSPYEIKTEEQLLAFAALVNGTANLSSITGENTVATRSDNFSGKTVQVADNIELSAATAWTSVGDASGKAFSGTFDGKEHTISGLTDSLFGYVQNGTLQNIVLGVSINKSAITAGLVLYLKGQSIIRDCTVSGIVEVTEKSASGIVYRAEAGSKIEHCVNNAKITITNGSNTMYAGGIVAVFNGSELKFCQNSGTIAGPVAGGIIGNRITKGGDIRNCLNTGEIKGTAYAGGIIGLITVAEEGTADQPFAVDNCRNEAVVTVSGTNAYAGGVIGFSDTNAWQSAKVTAVNLANIGAVTAENGTAGGVIGGKTEIGNTEVVLVLHNSYNRGTVTGSQAYGLSGAGDITNSYYACRVNAEDKVSYVDKNSIEQSVSTTNYKVGETDETLVDTLNANRGTALAWFVNPEKDVKWPIFAVKWNGDKDENSPLAAIKVTYDANGGEGGYVDVVYTPADTDGKPTECTYTVLGIADTGIISDNGTFVTWNETQSGGESGSHTPGSTMEFTGDITLYAQWDAIWAGTGTESDPYQISNLADLTALQTQVNDKGFSYMGKYFALPANGTITLTGEWTPIGNNTATFSGNIEGNNATINGLSVTRNDSAGLFECLSPRGTTTYIRNLTISGTATSAYGHAGGLAAAVDEGNFTLSNITTNVAVSAPRGSAGGLIGYAGAPDGGAKAHYQDRKDVSAAIDKALDYLSEQQLPSGGFVKYGDEDVEEDAAVLEMLAALDISLTDERFTKDGHTVLDGMMGWYQDFYFEEAENAPNQGFYRHYISWDYNALWGGWYHSTAKVMPKPPSISLDEETFDMVVTTVLRRRYINPVAYTGLCSIRPVAKAASVAVNAPTSSASASENVSAIDFSKLLDEQKALFEQGVSDGSLWNEDTWMVTESDISSFAREVLAFEKANGGLSQNEKDQLSETMRKLITTSSEYYMGNKGATFSKEAVRALVVLGMNPADVDGLDYLAPLTSLDGKEFREFSDSLMDIDAVDPSVWRARGVDVNVLVDEYAAAMIEYQMPNGKFDDHYKYVLEKGDDWQTSKFTNRDEVKLNANIVEALAAHQDKEYIAKAVENAIEYLSSVQFADGSFPGRDGQPDGEATLAVLDMMNAAGISLDDERFVKNGNTVADGLRTFYIDGLGFVSKTEVEADAESLTELPSYESNVMDFSSTVSALTYLQAAENGKFGPDGKGSSVFEVVGAALTETPLGAILLAVIVVAILAFAMVRRYRRIKREQ